MAEAIAIQLFTLYGTLTGTTVIVSATTLAAATAVVTFVGVTAASMAASKLLAPKMPSFSDASLSERSQMVRSPISARSIVYGRCKVSGTIVYLSTTGSKNQFLNIVVTLAAHEIEAIDEVYFNDELVPLTGTSNLPDAGSFYDGYALINKKLGVPGDAADADLIAATSGLTDGKWTSDHKLSGIAYLYVRLTWDAEKFPSGIPNISAVIRGKQVFDPRTSTTTYSANAALCLRDYLTDSTLGMSMSAAEIDDTAFSVAANICDEQVEIKPITIPATYENRYEANGVIVTSASPDENIGKILSAMGGLIAYTGGRIVPYASSYRIPTVTLSEMHFVGPLNVQTRTSARDRVNSVKGVYISETNDWQVTDFPTISDAQYVSDDNGTVFFRDVVLPFTTSPSCAQRLAVIELRRAREEITFSARFRLEAMQVRAGDTVMISNAKLGWSSKVFEVMEWNFASDGSPPQVYIDMTLRETAASIYTWQVGDQIFVEDAPNTTLPNPFVLSAPTNLTLVADGTTQQIQADGTALPRIKVSWTAPSEEFIQSGGTIGIEYKEGASTTYLTWMTVPGDQETDYISSDVKIGLTYDVRIYGESYFGVSTTYVTASVTVVNDSTPPSSPLASYISAESASPVAQGKIAMFAIGISVTAPPDTNVSKIELKVVNQNDATETAASWFAEGNQSLFSLSISPSAQVNVFFYQASFSTAGWGFVRAISRSGIASSWTAVGSVQGSPSLIKRPIGTVAQYDANDVTTTGIKTGGGASTRQINVVFSDSVVVSLAGGSPTESFNVNIAARGFSVKPDAGVAQCASDANISAAYDFDSVSNSGTNAVVRVATLDGANIAAGNYRFSVEFTDYT